MKWYQVFSYWLLAAWFLGLDVYALMVLGAIATFFGQLYIIRKSGWHVRWEFVIFRIFTHIVPLFYVSHRTDPVHVVTILALYMLFLSMQSLNPVVVYKSVFSEPPNMSIKEYLHRRFI
jgi:hypothetical protein